MRIAERIVHRLLEEKKEDKTEWIGVDLDGTLAHDSGWKGRFHVGRPIQKMRRRVLKWIDQGKKVKIFTARAKDKSAVPAIKRWLQKHGMEGVEVTNEKDKYMTKLWDDKAVSVEHNTGERK